MPEGGKLFIYTPQKEHYIGAFTSLNNKGDQHNVQGFATGLLYGDTITLEYYQQGYVKQDATISIAYVIHGYKYININNNLSKTRNNSEGCQININSSEGANWQDEKRAIALIIIDGSRICTGALLATTENDYQPLLLTANHCLGSANSNTQYDAINNPILNYWTFIWNYESPGYNNTFEAPDQASTASAIVLANNKNSDFALLQLTEDPKNSIIPYYLGWDRTGNSGTGGVGIHHPLGETKKISTYTMVPVSENEFWRINWASTLHGQGTTEPGSSGSPLINNSHRVIGQLYGGYSGCDNPTAPDRYGKFSTSWSGNNTNTGRLSNWLDPNSLGLSVYDGSYPTKLIGPSLIVTDDFYYIRNLPPNYTVEWSLSDSYYNQHCLQQNYPAPNQCTITYSSGHYMINATLTATIKYNGNTIQTLTKTVSAYDDFHGQYTSDNLSGEIDGTHQFYVKPNVVSTITSPMLQGASVGYDYSGTIPTTFNFSVGQRKLYFTMPANNNGKPVIINVEDLCGNYFKLYAMPYNSYYMNITYGDGSIDIEMKETVADGSKSDALKMMNTADDQTWQYEIWSSAMGTLKTAQTVSSRSTTISTAGWPKGVYVIKARIGKEEVTEKIVVK